MLKSILWSSVVMCLMLALPAQAKTSGYNPGDPEYPDYTSILDLVLNDWGESEDCAIELFDFKKRDGSIRESVHVGRCTLPPSRQICFTDNGNHCFTGAEAVIRGRTDNVSLKKNSAKIRWTMWIYNRCEDSPDHTLTFNYKFKKVDDVWTTRSKSIGIILDLRNRCNKILKEQAKVED